MLHAPTGNSLAAVYLHRTFSHPRFRPSVKAHDPVVDKRARASRSRELSPHIVADPSVSFTTTAEIAPQSW